MNDFDDTKSDELDDILTDEQADTDTDEHEAGTSDADAEKAKADDELDEAPSKSDKDADKEKVKQNTLKSVEAKLANNESIPKDQLWAVKAIEAKKADEQPKPEAYSKDDFAKDYNSIREQERHEDNKEFVKSLPTDLKKDIVDKARLQAEAYGSTLAIALSNVLHENEARIEKEVGHARRRRFGAGTPPTSKTPKSSPDVTSTDNLTKLAAKAAETGDYTEYNEAVSKKEGKSN